MRLAIRHTTRYHFTQPVTYSLQRLRLTPRTSPQQSVLRWELDFTGAAEELRFEDQHHNHVTLVSVAEGAQDVAITCQGEVDTRDAAGITGRHTGHMPLWSFLRQTSLTQPGEAMRDLGEPSRGATDRIAMLHELSARILQHVRYTKGTTDTRTTGKKPAPRAKVCARTTPTSSSASPANWVCRRAMSAGI
jgi:transglutaminase-like putative cysteine protease